MADGAIEGGAAGAADVGVAFLAGFGFVASGTAAGGGGAESVVREGFGRRRAAGGGCWCILNSGA